MKMCDKHWAALRQAIEARGLTHLIQSAETNLDNAAQVIEGADEAELPYDPLMSCWWMISGQAIKLGGVYLMSGDYCPICEAVKHTTGHPRLDEHGVEVPATAEWIESWWIDGPADAAHQECRRRGLVKES